MGWRLVKEMTKNLLSKPGRQRYWGGNLAPSLSFPNLSEQLKSLRCLRSENA